MSLKSPLKFAAFTFLAAIVWGQVRAETDWLVTPAEVERERLEAPAVRPPLRTRAMAIDGPELVLVKPSSLAEPLKAPFPINLVFKPRDGAAIVPDSFRAYYGAFRLDITDRIVKHARVAATGISLDKAEIPGGSHRLVLQVKDERNRVGEMELRFSVE